MKLRTKKSYFHNLPEGNAPSRVLPFLFKIGYFALLIALVVGVSYFLMNKYVYFSGRGYVEIARVKVSPLYGGIVREIQIKNGEEVVGGEVLGRIERAQKCIAIEPDLRLQKLAFEIRQMKEQYNFYLGSLYELGEGYSEDVVYRALEIGDALTRKKHEKLLTERQRLLEKTELLGLEIRLKEEELEMVREELSSQVEPHCAEEIIIAPFSGTVERITRTSSEFINKGEPLFVMSRGSDQVVIAAFLDDNDLQHLAIGKQVVVTFPDKKKSVGVVTGIGSTAKEAVELEKVDYMPVHTKVRVLVEPIHENDRLIWAAYDRMDVRIKGERK